MRISDWSSDVCSSDLPGRPIADCSGAADHDPCADREVAHDGIADRASGVVVIDVDSVRTGVTEGKVEVVGMIVERRVITELIDAGADLGSPPRDADGATAHQLGDLAGRRDRKSTRLNPSHKCESRM